MVYDKQALDALALALIKAKESIAVAESVTAGHLQAALSGATKAMQFFQGGITLSTLMVALPYNCRKSE
jgi:nicotinamide-nucleotide amidase